MNMINIQIGKQGLTSGFFQTLENALKKHVYVKIHVLKSAGHTKENLKEIAEKIKKKMGEKYLYKTLGFTIFIKRLRKAKR